MQQEHEKPWAPLSPAEAAAVFQKAGFSWWIAGGHAIEHFVGRPIRTHGDIDILVLRRDAAMLRCYLSDWDCWLTDPPGRLRSWGAEEVPGDGIHGVWCRRHQDASWAFEIMLDDSDGFEWRSRRCSDVRKPLQDLGIANGQHARFLVPEVQLFYKAKAPRPKDELDLDAALPLLSPAQRAWMNQSIERAYGSTNAWAARLRTL